VNPVNIIGPRTVEVGGVDRELERIWKTLAPPPSDEAPPVMQASVVNLVAVTDTAKGADSTLELLARVMSKAPCRAIVLDSEPEQDPPGVEAAVSVVCDTVNDRQICCEAIRVTARGISADTLPLTAAAFYAADLPVLVWWRTGLGRPDLIQFAASADRIVIDSVGYNRTEMQQAASLVGESRRLRTAVSDLNWARLTPYRQLFAQFFDSTDMRSKLKEIDSVAIEATEPAGLLMYGWLLSRLGDAPYGLDRDQVNVTASALAGPVFHSVILKSQGAEYAVVRTGHDTVEARSSVGGETVVRVARVPLAPVEQLLVDEIGRTGRDRAYDAALRTGVY
jgi:glucose-6-phosphate dehydrogenase assembly protein OpcA